MHLRVGIQKKAEERWGIGVVEQLSKDLQNEFPNTEGFTIRNLQSMKQWYLFYSSLENEQKLKQAVSQFEKYSIQHQIAISQIASYSTTNTKTLFDSLEAFSIKYLWPRVKGLQFITRQLA